MRRLGLLAAVVLVAAAAYVLVAVDPVGFESTANLLSALVILGAIGVGYLTLGGSTATPDDRIAPAPWTPEGGLVDRSPERSVDTHDLSGEALSTTIQRAGRAARRRGTVEDGLAVLRPALRVTLIDALVQGGMDRADAERAIVEGTWTDDAAAAATLYADASRPDWSLGRRLRAWLFPERVVRSEARRAVHAIARAAHEHVPTVPGRRAPRTVPVVRPTLADLQRGADDELQPAVDPLVDPDRAAGARVADGEADPRGVMAADGTVDGSQADPTEGST